MAMKRAMGMVRVVFPEPQEADDGSALTMPGVLEEHVFVWEFWRTRDTTPLALALLTKFDPSAVSADLTPLEAEKLEQGMQLAGKACSRALNRYYLRCLLAVQRAEPVKS